ncbi:DUF4007 family protein [Clostridium perfringens]|uniref:DUF4007 family protein n=1 Tax=Clostridium perfringens TaxID=1502 RepID=UPI0018D833AB|nr:DUF4007 family protein [Clostridium perfringens]MDU1811750.1 DUF4007 family protein [Clostridium perfringens]QPS29517.1 DUF4007 family protein [Clostridium perfringens]STB44750.1 Uncharacterised protein [Clostridium perfringens]
MPNIKGKKKIRIKGHGSFYLREGWITKGLKEIKINPYVFSDKNAADILGVGSNMVSAIKYWITTLGLVESKVGENRKTKYILSNLGKIIYEKDLYIEERFTLWILHYMLVKNQNSATTWNLVFNNFDVKEFSKDELFNFLNLEYTRLVGEGEFSVKSLNDDCTCLLKTYYSDNENLNPEENLICPFSELNILERKKNRFDKYVYTKLKINKSKLNPLVILYVLNDRSKKGSTTIDRLIEEENNIGKVFNLDRNEVNEYLDILEKQGYIEINRTAGLNTVYVKTNKNILNQYYDKE